MMAQNKRVPLQSIPRQLSFSPPLIPNPFVHKLQFSTADKLQMCLAGLILLPIRALGMVLILLLVWPFAAAATYCSDGTGSKPITGWQRKIVQNAIASLGRCMFFIMGFRVKVKGQLATPVEAPILAVAPHSTFFDAIVCVVAGLPSTVSRTENISFPVFGRILQASQPVLVSRLDPDSRKNTINEISKRATSGGDWPQILIFPEGTCTNRSCLITFKQEVDCIIVAGDVVHEPWTLEEGAQKKLCSPDWNQRDDVVHDENFGNPLLFTRANVNRRHQVIVQLLLKNHLVSVTAHFEYLLCCLYGAFIPGVPVQPILLRYPNRLDTVTWTWQGYTLKKALVMTLCQLVTNVEIEFMPVHIPTKEEQDDSSIFANHVRMEMATALDVPVTDHTFEDCRLMISAGELTLPMEAGLVEFTKISKKLNIKWDNVRNELDKFAEIAANSKGGRIGIAAFANYLKLPITDVLSELFGLFDRNGDGSIDFREYVIGVNILCNPANTEETIQMAFKLFDLDDDGSITEDEFTGLLRSALGVPDLNVSKLFKDIDADKSGKLNYNEFKDFALNHPEYAKLFTSYLEYQRYFSYQITEEPAVPHMQTNVVSPEPKEAVNNSDKKED